MPFYEYECAKCGYHDEVLQKISDKPLTKCPNCGKAGLRKLISAPVFRLKGSGWYETDFKSDKENKRNLAGAEKEEAKSDSKADSAKPESTPAATPAADKPAADKPAAKPAKTAARAKPKQKNARKRR
jgi:putative FmdB family regulatory protein